MINDLDLFEERHSTHSASKNDVFMALLRHLILVRVDKSPLHPTIQFSSSPFGNLLFCLCLKERHYINRGRLETAEMSSVGEVIRRQHFRDFMSTEYALPQEKFLGFHIYNRLH